MYPVVLIIHRPSSYIEAQEKRKESEKREEQVDAYTQHGQWGFLHKKDIVYIQKDDR